jgi:MSHA pilin protein MshD
MSIDRRHQLGLTLIELVLFIVIVSVSVIGILQVMNQTSVGSVDPLRTKQALAIAESLLEEVELSHFTYCDPTDPLAATAINPAGCSTSQEALGPEAGNVRPYDNVNDYSVANGTAFNDATGVLVDSFGNRISGAGYSATVTIAPANLASNNGTIASNASPDGMNVLLITVTVSYGSERFAIDGSRDSIVLEGYRTRYAPNAIP